MVKVNESANFYAICPKCGDRLFLSDCPQYDYVCFNCDENFYKCEVEEYE